MIGSLQTTVNVARYPFELDHTMHGLVLGSCFADHVGGWLARGKMPLEVNPFGVLYNPLSIVRALDLLGCGKEFCEDDLFEYNGLYSSEMHHGSFSCPDQHEALCGINDTFRRGVDALQKADYITLTLGTAWVYERQGRVVANCHKRPSSDFMRRRLSVDEIVQALGSQINTISSDRPGPLHWILTVSPVVHLSDGLIENQISKSTLIVAAAELSTKLSNVFYFPSYEIVTSELRDYRFYDRDMCHPAPIAVDYVRERFCEALLSPQARELISRVEAIHSAMNHRPLHPNTPAYDKFRLAMRRKVEMLQKEWPQINLTAELQFFS